MIKCPLALALLFASLLPACASQSYAGPPTLSVVNANELPENETKNWIKKVPDYKQAVNENYVYEVQCDRAKIEAQYSTGHSQGGVALHGFRYNGKKVSRKDMGKINSEISSFGQIIELIGRCEIDGNQTRNDFYIRYSLKQRPREDDVIILQFRKNKFIGSRR